MMDSILTNEFNANGLEIMTLKIKQHHSYYVKLFGNTLKPKFHFILHYPIIIKRIGPLKQIWCFRFESKHRELKQYTNNINSRKNIPYTIGIKCALKFSYRLLSNHGFKNVIEYNSKHNKLQNLHEKEYFLGINLDSVESIEFNNIIFLKHIVYKGTQYEIKFLLLSKSLHLYKIIDICITKDNSVNK